jgi:hypothetical protein
MRRVAHCGLLALFVLAMLPAGTAAAEEDRKAFCAAITEFVRDHPISADAKPARLERWIAGHYSAAARYARPARAEDLRMLAAYYRSNADTGSGERAAAIVEHTMAEIAAAKGRTGRYEIELCLPKRKR